MNTNRHSTLNGLTLIELLVTIAIIGTITALALPKFTNMIKNNAQVSNVNGYIALLNFARNEAVTRESNVVLCATTDSTATTPDCNSSNWEAGWILFNDIGSTANNFDSSDVLIKRAAGAIVGNTIRTTFTTTGRLTFAKNGLASSTGTISFCDDRGITESRALTVSRVGRVSSLGRGNATVCP